MPNITIKVNGELQNFQEAEILKLMEVGTGEPVFFTYGSVTSGGNTYEIPFYLNPTEAQAANINNIINTILADESSYNVVVTDGYYRMPAITMLTDRGISYVVALLIWPDGTANDNFKYEIKRTASGVITTAQNILSLGGGGGGVTAETDPTVPDWAKSPTKPSYTKSEVGLGNVDNVKQYSESNPPPYPVASVNGKTGAVSLSAGDVKALPDTYTPPDQTAAQVGADPKGTADSKVSAHNTSNTSHNDIRLLISGLTTRLNALADSTDTDLDQLSEIVAYIKSNKSLIDGITTNKVNVSDIINNLTTNVANKPLSAAQGVALKALIDAITVPTKLSQLTGDSTHRVVTDAEKTTWNAKSDFSGAYSDLTGKPTLPTVPTKISAFENDKGYITNTELGSAVDDALTEAKESGEFDGHTPVKGVDYYTDADKAEFSEYIATELAKRGQLAPEYADSVEWLKANGDTSKMYVLPDGFIYAYMLTEKEVSSGGGYTNLIDGTNGYVKDGYRYSASSSAFKPLTGGASIIIPIPTSGSITIRVRGMKFNAGYPTVYGGTTNTTFTNCFNDTVLATNTYDANGDWYFTFTNTKSVSYIVTTGILTGAVADVIATVNEEIVEGGTEIVTEYAWVSTGLAFVPADYEPRIIELENEVSQHTTDIANLKKGITTSTPIKEWDAPIYDANIPVFELSAEKAAMTNATNTPDNIYDMYDALMAKHPRYITKTDLGLCSDGVNHVYRYDFCEPEPLHEINKVWSETKAKAIIVTGIHYEWAGIYAMYNALEEIADNPELRNFRRNTHLIVVPCANPYATIVSNYQSGLSTPNSYGVRNANGVEIHRNFEIDWVLTEAGSTHYGGASPLSEVETQYIDNIMKNNTDAAFFLSCHNCGVDTFWGTGFIWASTATKYMCNMGYRVIDKLSDAWMDKCGDTLSAGIAEYKTDLLEDGETRLGWTGLSTSPGTEAKQATKYGIQGTNVEICDPFQIHGTKASPEPSMSAFTMSRGAEVYVNFLLTAFGVYDHKDKKEYAPTVV